MLPEGYCEIHKVSGLITNGDNSWLWVYYSAIVILHLAHAVDYVPLGNIFAVRANNVNLKYLNLNSCELIKILV